MWFVAKFFNGNDCDASQHIIAVCTTEQGASDLAGKLNSYHQEVGKPDRFIIFGKFY